MFELPYLNNLVLIDFFRMALTENYFEQKPLARRNTKDKTTGTIEK